MDSDLRHILGGRTGRQTILSLRDRCAADDSARNTLLSLVFDSDSRVAYNALWILTHFSAKDKECLAKIRNQLIDRMLQTDHTGQRRLILSLLDSIKTDADDVRTDYLDFCLSTINSTEPYGVRALCLKQAYAMCRLYPDLLPELTNEIALMDSGTLSPGLLSVRRKVIKALYSMHNSQLYIKE